MSNILSALQRIGVGCRVRLQHGTQEPVGVVHTTVVVPLNAGTQEVELQVGLLRVVAEVEFVATDKGSESCSDGALQCRVTAKVVSGQAPSVNLALEWVVSDWNTNNYLLMPAAVYAGNRFDSRRINYPPIFSEPHPVPLDAVPVTTDIPGLQRRNGEVSRVQQLAGDLATPALVALLQSSGHVLALSCPQQQAAAESGLDAEESSDELVMRIASPGVRNGTRYFICDNQRPSTDRGIDVSSGSMLTLDSSIHLGTARSVPEVLSWFWDHRESLSPTSTSPSIPSEQSPPLSFASDTIREKYNASNWHAAQGLYRVGIGTDLCCHWQVGWVGGILPTYAFLAGDDELSQQRARRNLDWLFANGQSESGYFFGIVDEQNRVHGDGFSQPGKDHWHLSRKTADALYFVGKQLLLLGDTADAAWRSGFRRCADAMVGTWERQGQWGQFVDIRSGEVVAGGSTSASTAPGGLALAWRVLDHPRYLRVARESAARLSEHFLSVGYTTGGPGEAMQCPDSESAFGLLECSGPLRPPTYAPRGAPPTTSDFRQPRCSAGLEYVRAARCLPTRRTNTARQASVRFRARHCSTCIAAQTTCDISLCYATF
jgi:hypothetical protein